MNVDLSILFSRSHEEMMSEGGTFIEVQDDLLDETLYVPVLLSEEDPETIFGKTNTLE